MKLRCACLVVVGLLLGADAKEDAAKLDKIQGAWEAVSGEAMGTPFDEDTIKSMKITFKDTKYTFTSSGETEKGTIKLDPTKKPAAIDFNITEGNDQGKNQVGIYELKDDTLRICANQPGEKERPTKFSSKDSNGVIIIEFKRLKQ